MLENDVNSFYKVWNKLSLHEKLSLHRKMQKLRNKEHMPGKILEFI